MVNEKMDPVIECGNGDVPVMAEIRYCIGALQVIEKYGKNEPERIGTIGYEHIRKKCMGMSAGQALKAAYSQSCINPAPVMSGDHVSFIGADLLITTDSTAFRTATLKRLES